MEILGFFEVLAMVESFRGDGFTRPFLTYVTKSPPEEFLSVTMDDSGSKLLAGTTTAVSPGLPHIVSKISLYNYAVALFPVKDEAASLRFDGK
jgi:hypothetical protein